MALNWNIHKNDPAPGVESPKPEVPPVDLTKELNEKIDKLLTISTTFEERLKQLETRPPIGQPDPNKPPDNPPGPPSDPIQSFYEDPIKAMNERVLPVYKETLEVRAEIAYDRIREKFGAEFEFFKGKFDEALKNVPLPQKANKDYLENLYRILRDRHKDEVAAGREQPFEPGKLGASSLEPKPEKPAVEQLTASELTIAKRYGISPEDYLKSKKEMNSPVLVERGM